MPRFHGRLLGAFKRQPAWSPLDGKSFAPDHDRRPSASVCAGKRRCLLRGRRCGKRLGNGGLGLCAGWLRRAAGETVRVAPKTPSRVVIISVLGVTQIFAWGSSYYLPAVLAKPIAFDTGWSLSWVVGGLSLGLLIAGLVSPWVGRAIARRGGRPVLAVSAALFAVGLSALALAHSLPAFLIAWALIGLGMGAGLYDPAFATLGRIYGHGGRSAITTLTLFGGFASTVCWPLSAFLDAHFGWRGACLVYAGFQLAVALPAYLFVLPRESPPAPLSVSPNSQSRAPTSHSPRGSIFLLVAATITLSSVISTTLSVHLLTVLQARGFTLAAAA
jgi:MFS family permease